MKKSGGDAKKVGKQTCLQKNGPTNEGKTMKPKTDFQMSGLSRRSFLSSSSAAIIGAGLYAPMAATIAAAQGTNDVVLETVRGALAGADVKKALAHEHFFADFYGPDSPDYMAVDWSDVYGACMVRAKEITTQDVNLLIEWTNIGIGRNIELLRNISQKTGLNIVFPTGIYKGLIPPAMQDMSRDEIAALYIEELTQGVEHTSSRAGFIKISTTEAGSSETETMLHSAAAIAARETGCTIALHSPIAETTWSVVETLKGEGFDLERLIWGHAQPAAHEEHLKMVDLGAMVEFDAISADSDPFFNGPTDDASMLDRIENLTSKGHQDQVIVSADACVFVNPPEWQYDRDSLYVHRYFAAKLAERIGEDMAVRVLRDNVLNAFRKGDKV